MALHNIRGSSPIENYFRKTVFFNERPDGIIVRIFSDTTYELFINGRLAVRLSEWVNTRDYELAADGVSILTSDRSWKCFPEERWGWILADFDDSAWEESLEMDLSAAAGPQWSTLPGSDPKKVIPSLDGCPFFVDDVPKCVDSPFYLRKKEPWHPSEAAVKVAGPGYLGHTEKEEPAELRAQSLRRPSAGTGTLSGDLQKGLRLTAPERYTGPSFIVDFGREMVGFFRMRLQSDGPVSFRLYHAETLSEAVYEPPRRKLQNRMLREEYRVEKGNQEFESRMRYGGRFMRVEFFDSPQDVRVEGFALRTELYAVNRRGYFHCSDPVLNRLWEMGERTVHYCMQEYYLDAPKRDRFLWVGDTRSEALFNYHLFADTRLFEFSWDEIARMQYPGGEIPSAYGAGLSQLWDYTALYVIAFQDYYLHTGNAVFLLKHRETILKAVDYLSGKTAPDGLIDVPPSPLGNLWSVVLNGSQGKDTLMNQYYLQALKCAETVCELAADPAGVQKYADRIALTGPAVEKLSAENPLESVERNWLSSTMLYQIVEKTAREKGVSAGLQLLREKWSSYISLKCDCFGEGFSLTGVKSIEEVVPFEENGSYCHGWTAAPVLFLPRWIAGIRPQEPGFSRFSVIPDPAGLDSFESVVPTPHGEIALTFKNGKYMLQVPAGCTADVQCNGEKIRFGEGIHSF